MFAFYNIAYLVSMIWIRIDDSKTCFATIPWKVLEDIFHVESIRMILEVRDPIELAYKMSKACIFPLLSHIALCLYSDSRENLSRDISLPFPDFKFFASRWHSFLWVNFQEGNKERTSWKFPWDGQGNVWILARTGDLRERSSKYDWGNWSSSSGDSQWIKGRKIKL